MVAVLGTQQRRTTLPNLSDPSCLPLNENTNAIQGVTRKCDMHSEIVGMTNKRVCYVWRHVGKTDMGACSEQVHNGWRSKIRLKTSAQLIHNPS